MRKKAISRRDFLKATAGAAGILGGLAVPGGKALAAGRSHGQLHSAAAPVYPTTAQHGGNITVGEVDVARMGYDPVQFLTHFDYGKVSKLPNGQTLREFRLVADEGREVEIAPGVFFPAWTFNGTVPSPTLRAREGDRV
ncbi:MAG: twin-arginine translocation signal domain-containing protein, partial [bacterium]